MSESNSIRYRYYSYREDLPNLEGTLYKTGDQVTVTMSNGCRANGVVDMNAESESARGLGRGQSIGGDGISYGNSTLRVADTGEVIYKVKITSGPSKGMVYKAHESQIERGWHADALGNTCDDGEEAHQTVFSKTREGIGDIDSDVIPFVITALAAVVAAVVVAVRKSKGGGLQTT